MGEDGGPLLSNRVLLRIPFWPFALVTAALPSLSLAICFITAFVFRFDDVNETACDVANFIPSVSAVTGITPQTYLWRISIALHCTPRLIVTILNYNRYLQQLSLVKKSLQNLFRTLIRLNFWLNVSENACLIGVTFVSNRENYPVHEKMFIVFMVTSLCYMLCNNICFRMSSDAPMTKDEERSYFWKKALFAITMTATAGLIYFYLRHRWLCEPRAFSYFSLCEYVIAYGSMTYHFTAYIEFKDNDWLVASPVGPVVVSNNNNKGQTASRASNPSTGADLRSRKH